jgi:dienelactone hydrolase
MIIEREIEYGDNGKNFQGVIAYDDANMDPRPGVLISHAWGGQGKFDANKARLLAEQGYVGFALDVYGKGVRGSNPEENAGLMQPLLGDRAELQSRMVAALKTIRSIPEVDENRIAAMGFCFGGLCVLDLARTGEALRGVISFHGLFNPPGNLDSQNIKAKILAIHGYDDPMVPPEAIDEFAAEMSAAGIDWQVHVYGNTKHAFTNPQANDPDRGTVYNADADRRSWLACLNFFAEVLE